MKYTFFTSRWYSKTVLLDSDLEHDFNHPWIGRACMMNYLLSNYQIEEQFKYLRPSKYRTTFV